MKPADWITLLIVWSAAASLPAVAQYGSEAWSGSSNQSESERPSELELPVDDSIKVSVEPLLIGSVVDRVVEPTTVTIKCPGTLSADVFIVPVDAPYGGHPLAKPYAVGKVTKTGDVTKVSWTSKEKSEYVKLFAVVRKKNMPDSAVRSAGIDLAISGARLDNSPR